MLFSMIVTGAVIALCNDCYIANMMIGICYNTYTGHLITITSPKYPADI